MRTTGLESILATGLVLTVVLLADQTAVAQPPGGSGAQMWMDRLDLNGDGRLDPDELSQSRFPLADMAERAGIDASRGLSAEDVEAVMENMRQQGGGFGGFGGDRGGFGSDRGGRGGDRGGRGGFERGGTERGSRTSDRSPQPKAPEPPPRVTVDLQATYAAADTNGDGQIEMSEWLRWKGRAALAEFLSLDRNNDGILTPRELAQADSPLPVDLAQRLPGADPAALQPIGGRFMASNPAMSGSPPIMSGSPSAWNGAPSAAAAATPAAVSSTPAAAVSPTPPAAAAQSTSPVSVSAPASADVPRHTADAQRRFKLLDTDGDGTVTDLEWRRSVLLRLKFEKAGVDLSQAMSEEQFISYYMKFAVGG